jgi:hypothetical protein
MSTLTNESPDTADVHVCSLRGGVPRSRFIFYHLSYIWKILVWPIYLSTSYRIVGVLPFFSSEEARVTTFMMPSLRRSSCCYWSAVDCGGRATCSWNRLAALLLERLLGVLFFTGARSMGRTVMWSPMKPERWSGWFPLKSSPTCSYRWLHCDL